MIIELQEYVKNPSLSSPLSCINYAKSLRKSRRQLQFQWSNTGNGKGVLKKKYIFYPSELHVCKIEIAYLKKRTQLVEDQN